MDQRQIDFVAAAIRDDLAAEGVELSDDQLGRVAVGVPRRA
jgi:hypothetical protein